MHLGVLDDRDLYDDYPVSDLPGVKRFSARHRSYGAGAFSYVLRPRTARRFLKLARQIGIMQAVDWWIVERFGEMVAYPRPRGRLRSFKRMAQAVQTL